MGRRKQRSRLPLRLAVFYIVVGLLAAEVGLRIFWTSRSFGQGIQHPHFHHRPHPHSSEHFVSDADGFDVTIGVNRYGLRGPEPVLPKPPGTVRILMLGDSYTFGFPVEDDETFVRLVESGLLKRGRRVEVVNGGVSGYSPTLHYISLRDQFLEFDPDLVVLWYDLGDLAEDHAFQKNLVRDDAGRIVRADTFHINGSFSVKEWLVHHVAVAKWVHTKVFRTLRKIGILGLDGYIAAKLRGERSKVAIARLKRERRTPDLAANDKFLLVREDTTRELIEPYWWLSEQYLLMIRDLLEERGIPLVLGVYPYGMVVGPDEWGDGRSYWGFERGRTYSAELFLDLIDEFADAHDIHLINSFNSFRKAVRKEQLFYDWDGHFTPAGHRVLAEHILRDRRFRRLVRSRK